MKRLAIAALAVTTVLTLAACSGSSNAGDLEASAAAIESAAEAGATSESAPPDNSTRTIPEIAATAPGFETLVAALNAAGLVETLNGEGPFTVFVPGNPAFDALPPGVLDALLLPENKEVLAKILSYHVVPGKFMAADITDGEVATLEGQKVTLSTADGVTVNGANVFQADVVGKNGVAHAIDAVLLPPDVDVNALLAE